MEGIIVFDKPVVIEHERHPVQPISELITYIELNWVDDHYKSLCLSTLKDSRERILGDIRTSKYITD